MNIEEQRLRNRESTGDRSLGDPCPEAMLSTYHSSNVNDSEQDETHHSWLHSTQNVHNKPPMSIGVNDIESEAQKKTDFGSGLS